MDFLSCILLLCLCFASTCFLIQALHRKLSRVRLPPGPKPFPLVGNLFELGDKPHLSLTKLSQLYGPIISLKLGQVTTVVVSSSTMAKEILRTHDEFLCNRAIPDALRAVEDYSLPWLPVSSRWRNLRKICNSQLFATKVLDANQENRRVKVQELIASVNDNMIKGTAVNIGEVAFRTSLNLLSRTIFSLDLADTNSSSSTNATAREFKEIVWRILEEAGKPNLGDYFPVLKKIDPQGIRRRFTNNYNKMLGFIESVINQRLQSRKDDAYVTSNDMLDTLINISEEKNEDMNLPLVKHLFVALFIAGTDTTSAALEWAMAELLNNPESLSKAQEELDQMIGKGKPIEESDISRLPYLQAVIKETFRLHPAGPFLLPRKANSDIEMGGYTVPKGAQVLVNTWAIGRDPCSWDNPSSFMPERFFGLDNQIDVMGNNFKLIPFGGGRRICPGLPLAMRMLHLMLGSLINCYDWKLEDGVVPETRNMEEKFGLTLQKAQPLKAVPKKL